MLVNQISLPGYELYNLFVMTIALSLLVSLMIASGLCIFNIIFSVHIRIIILQRCSNLQKSNENKMKIKQQQGFIHLSLYFNLYVHIQDSTFDRLMMLFHLFSLFSGRCLKNECALPSSQKVERMKYLRSISSMTKVCSKIFHA